MGALDDVVRHAGPPLGEGPTEGSLRLVADADPRGELAKLLRLRDGFYAFSSALHVFPAGPTEVTGLLAWNKPELWRGAYGLGRSDLLFFAEDAFGGQFGVCPDGVVVLDPETGELEAAYEGVEGWARAVLDEPEVVLAEPSLVEWQTANRELRVDERLVPVKPFVLGGSFDADNLYALEAAEGMRVRADIARQLRDVPDGTQVRLTTRASES